jgi:RNA-directed DNA polymerase
MHENREISGASRSNQDRDRSAKAQSHNADMHVSEKSDCAILPMNQPNKGESSPAEVGEGRARTKENIVRSNTSPTQSGERVSQGLSGVRQAAKERRQERFTALLHHMTVGLLRDSFYALKRQAAPGVDGVTWKEYETGLDGRIADLHSRVHRGAYQAQPSRRVYIPKADGRQRPLGIAALEDKIVQQAVVTILNQIYEVDFKGFSYGFRPGRNPHQALDALAVGIQGKRVSWVLDADIRGFFDNLSHEWAIQFVEHRVADRRILRLIQKWLKAGVSEDGQWSESKVGTPQGAVVTPRTQKITSSLSDGWSFGGNPVRVDSCRIRLYVYDRWHVPASLRRPSGSIAHAICCCMSISSPMRSNSWPGIAPFRRVKPIATSNKLSG